MITPSNEKSGTESQRILVTGASGAVGLSTCERLVERGDMVAGTMRSRSGRNAEVAANLDALGVTVIEMDVTDEASVEAGASAAIEALGGLDVVFNNAGIGAFGVQEMFSADEMHRVFDVNVYGVQRVMRAVLPHLRAQGYGTVIYTSSLIGRIAIPFYATYCASKWALEAIAQGYRAELCRFGIDSCIIEPGAMPTAFLDGMLAPGDDGRGAAYQPELEALEPALKGMVDMLDSIPAQRPEMVADAVVDVVGTTIGHKPFRVAVDFTGMGEPIADYNDHLARITRHVYTAFGTDGMLALNPAPAPAH